MQRPTLIPYKEAPSYNLVHKSTKLTYLLHMLHVPKWKDPILSRVSCGDILFLRIGLAPLKQRQPRKRSNHLIYTNFSILVRSHFSGGYYGKPRNRGPTHHRPPRLKEHLQLQQELQQKQRQLQQQQQLLQQQFEHAAHAAHTRGSDPTARLGVSPGGAVWSVDGEFWWMAQWWVLTFQNEAILKIHVF